ncbi:MAG: hypothetical protein SXA11_26585 [Cyanobacteriota bacterium]|nr:hypothetical protein [Cyanobacteriota bacterium]
MYSDPQGIPNLPDITHPQELIEFGNGLVKASLTLAILVGFLAVAIALVSFALRQQPAERTLFLGQWAVRYSALLKGLQHLALILTVLVVGFFFCSTLSNRYHHWEQQRITQVANTVAGDRLEQTAPRIRYVIEEPYTYYRWVDGEQVEVNTTRQVDRFLAIDGSQIQVSINQATDVQNEKAVYVADFQANYEVVNLLNERRNFFFEMSPPYGYSLLQDFRVERNGERLVPVNPGDYGFPFRLEPGESSSFRVRYKAQGGPRWIYNANGQLLSNFRLTALANFPKADFASGIVPTETVEAAGGRRFTWLFDDNVSVRNPFGVFTATEPVRNTGVLPRLLILAPGLFLWWIILLYLSLPMSLRDVAIAAGIFFACLLTLTYASRIVDAKLGWFLISPILLVLVWGLGGDRRASLAAVIATIAGGILPVLALLVPYSGLTLALAGLLSAGWLAARDWYGVGNN